MHCVSEGQLSGHLGLLKRLRDCFGKGIVWSEDMIRLRSIRAASSLRSSAPEGGLDGDDFLLKGEAVINFNLGTDLRDNRALELINKNEPIQSEWKAIQ